MPFAIICRHQDTCIHNITTILELRRKTMFNEFHRHFYGQKRSCKQHQGHSLTTYVFYKHHRAMITVVRNIRGKVRIAFKTIQNDWRKFDWLTEPLVLIDEMIHVLFLCTHLNSLLRKHLPCTNSRSYSFWVFILYCSPPSILSFFGQSHLEYLISLDCEWLLIKLYLSISLIGLVNVLLMKFCWRMSNKRHYFCSLKMRYDYSSVQTRMVMEMMTMMMLRIKMMSIWWLYWFF